MTSAALSGGGQGDLVEVRRDLLVRAALRVELGVEAALADDVGLDAAGVHRDGRDAGAAQLLRSESVNPHTANFAAQYALWFGIPHSPNTLDVFTMTP